MRDFERKPLLYAYIHVNVFNYGRITYAYYLTVSFLFLIGVLMQRFMLPCETILCSLLLQYLLRRLGLLLLLLLQGYGGGYIRHVILFFACSLLSSAGGGG